jgi:putative CRISPR-associated protein (TIGR02619 family)
MKERNVLICTVGTSLFQGNLRNLPVQNTAKPDNWEAMYRAFEQKQWPLLARELARVNPQDRICGAEINTIYDLVKIKRKPIQKVYFLVSDTEDGEHTGKVLQEYFSQHPDFRFSEVSYQRVEKLQDQNPQDFKVYGLRNLVREIGAIIQRLGGHEYIQIDATGGYKAQIAIAVLIGQVLNIPVSYKHERFSEIIDFPPLPVAFDYTIIGRYAGLLSYLERGTNALTAEELELDEEDEKLRVFLDELMVGKQTLFALSPIGELYLMGYRLRHTNVPTLVPAGDKKDAPHFRPDHYPNGFKEFVTKVWRDTPWIITTHSLEYSKQKSIKGIGFNVVERDGKIKLVGTYRDGNDFSARFDITCTDESIEALRWAASYLNQQFG